MEDESGGLAGGRRTDQEEEVDKTIVEVLEEVQTQEYQVKVMQEVDQEAVTVVAAVVAELAVKVNEALYLTAIPVMEAQELIHIQLGQLQLVLV